MQEAIALVSTPHFVIFFVIEIAACVGIYLGFKALEKVGEYLTASERTAFRAKYAKRSDRNKMPDHFETYAVAWDRSLRTTCIWLGLSTVGVLILFYKLMELYAL